MLKGVKRPDKFETKQNFAVSCIEHLEDFWLLHGARGDAWSMLQTLVPMVLVQNYWRIPFILNSVSFKTTTRTQRLLIYGYEPCSNGLLLDQLYLNNDCLSKFHGRGG
ncbi:hypothetical protein Droror1_Dr00003919 [Drosera rotundifolia]